MLIITTRSVWVNFKSCIVVKHFALSAAFLSLRNNVFSLAIKSVSAVAYIKKYEH